MVKSFNTQAEAILHFYRNLRPAFDMADGISLMNPYKNPATWAVAKQFYEKFYRDDEQRAFIFGINPGRHGAGLTGVPFTDPLRLEEKCGIPNEWKKQAELSSQFVYAMIDGYGGVGGFFFAFFSYSVQPPVVCR